MYSVSDETRKPIFEGVQGENEAREIQFDVTAWVEELGEGVCTATAKRPTDATPYPVTVTRSGNVVTWKPNSVDTAIEGVGAFQLEYSINDSIAKTRIWNTKIAPSLDPAGDPPDPYDNWLAEMRQIAADALQDAQDADASAQDAEAWAKGTKNGTPVPSTADQHENNAKYYAEQSAENQYGAYIVKSASGEIASFSDGADDVPMKSLNVTITPKQSGSGDPSPSNVRPITGWTTVNVYRGGHNYVEDLEAGAIGSDGSEEATSNAKRTPYIPVTEGEKVVCEWKNADAGYRYSRIALYDANKVFQSFAYNAVTGAGKSHTEVVTIPSGIAYLRFCSYNCPPQIIYKVIDNLDVTPVPLGQTVYGGTVNPISGELVIDRVLVDGGSYNWTYWTGSAYFTSISNKTAVSVDDIQSDIYPTKTVVDAGLPNGIMNNISSEAVKKYIYIVDGDVADAAALKTKLTGHQICYRINNPTTVQLTPAQVATLLGTNNVWADCGSVEVEYRADPTLAYAELQALILENL